MPIKTTFEITRPSGWSKVVLSYESTRLMANESVLKWCSANQSWPTISATVKFLEKPCLPVEQKRQLTAQPAWDEMHKVPRSSSGIKTISTALLSPTSNNHLRVPSLAVWSLKTGNAWISAICSSCKRKLLARSLIWFTSATPRWWIQCMSCFARKGFWSKPATKRPSPSPSRFNKLVRGDGFTSN